MLKWDEKYSVGNVRCDAEHYTILKMINGLVIGSRTKISLPAISRIVADLVDYTKIHFTHEENIMREIGYPEDELAKHIELHQAFELRINRLNTGTLLKNDVELDRLVNFLIHWWISHIGKTDQKYAEYIKNK